MARRRLWRKIYVASLLLGARLFFPRILPAQSQSSSPALTQQQTAGRRLFMQNCSLCHLSRSDNPKSTETGSAFGGDLKGLFKGPRPISDQVVQAFILRGVPKKMPGFQYGLKLEEINNIISYLKTL